MEKEKNYYYSIESIKELKKYLEVEPHIFRNEYGYKLYEESYAQSFYEKHLDDLLKLINYGNYKDEKEAETCRAIQKDIENAKNDKNILKLAQYVYTDLKDIFKNNPFLAEKMALCRIENEFKLHILMSPYDNNLIDDRMKDICNFDNISNNTDYLIAVNSETTYKALKEKIEENKIINFAGALDYKLIVKELTKRELDAPILLMFDFDDNSQANQTTLKKELQDNFKVAEFSTNEKDKDLKDIIQEENFKSILDDNLKKAQEIYDKDRDTLKNYIYTFLKINEYRAKNYKPIVSGMNFDKYIDGGLYENQTFFIGAPSGVGKTAFCLQWAYNIAKYEGQYVLYIALEQPRLDLVARILSRLIFENHMKDNGIDLNNIDNLKENFLTMRDLTTGRFWKDGAKNSDKKSNYLKDEIIEFEKVASQFEIYEVKESTDLLIEEIEKKINRYKKFVVKDNKLVVFIDYLQLINFDSNVKVFSDNSKIDYVISQIKRIANKENITIVCIASNNRESNKTDNVALENFKGTANIEYTADIAAQIYIDKKSYIDIYKGKNTQFDEFIKKYTYKNKQGKEWTDEDSAINDFLQNTTHKKYTMKILKSRNFKAPTTIHNFDFYGAYSYFDMSNLQDPYEQLILKGFEDMAPTEKKPRFTEIK